MELLPLLAAFVLAIRSQREAGMLDTLSSEFDALLARMQVPGAAEAMHTAFAMAPAEMGRAAVQMADRDILPRRAKAPSRRKRAVKKARA